MTLSELLDGMTLELRRGTVVLCVLCKLKEPMYGYSLLNNLIETGIQVEANTLYPLLRRLEGQGLLESRWDTSEAKPRKYYQTTSQANELCQKLIEQWEILICRMKKVTEEYK